LNIPGPLLTCARRVYADVSVGYIVSIYVDADLDEEVDVVLGHLLLVMAKDNGDDDGG
jgi:hypothetical protein